MAGKRARRDFGRYLAIRQPNSTTAAPAAAAITDLDSCVIFSDRFEDCAKLRNIPLTTFNLINQMSPDILIDELEDLIETPARSNDA
jgi:hypothetical protein